ncbi:MAG: ABC transporter ATP-binding protein [Planctomycetes bacterium]|nr:ABC transporter ATP-binding protein [Planctomycetota bacterium]
MLEVVELRKSYGDFVAVNGLSFEIQTGEVFGLLGPNGAGKSTTMTMIAGLKRADSGSITLDGWKMSTHFHKIKNLLGLVPQDFAIYPDLTARENLNFFGRLYGIKGPTLQQRVDKILDQTGLMQNANGFAGTFSGGMKRRLNFGVALLHQPKLVILDEPTVGVDPQSRSHLLDCVKQVSAEGTAVIYASHYMEEVEAICQRIAIIDHGKLLTCGTLDNLLSANRADVRLRVHGTKPRLGPRLVGLAEVDEISDDEVHVILPRSRRDSVFAINDRMTLILEILKQAGTEVLAIDTEEYNLERLFLELTGRRLRD